MSLHLGMYEMSDSEHWLPSGLHFLIHRWARSVLYGKKTKTLGAADKTMGVEPSCSLPRPPRVSFPGRALLPLELSGEAIAFTVLPRQV